MCVHKNPSGCIPNTSQLVHLFIYNAVGKEAVVLRFYWNTSNISQVTALTSQPIINSVTIYIPEDDVVRVQRRRDWFRIRVREGVTIHEIHGELSTVSYCIITEW